MAICPGLCIGICVALLGPMGYELNCSAWCSFVWVPYGFVLLYSWNIKAAPRITWRSDQDNIPLIFLRVTQNLAANVSSSKNHGLVFSNNDQLLVEEVAHLQPTHNQIKKSNNDKPSCQANTQALRLAAQNRASAAQEARGQLEAGSQMH